jgi:hypothetical protein
MRRLGISCAYLRDAASRPSGRAMFERLAARTPRLALHVRVLQGERDENTPARFVHELEAWNAEAGHLDLSVRYYDGDHRGTPEARRFMTELLLGIVARAP